MHGQQDSFYILRDKFPVFTMAVAPVLYVNLSDVSNVSDEYFLERVFSTDYCNFDKNMLKCQQLKGRADVKPDAYGSAPPNENYANTCLHSFFVFTKHFEYGIIKA